MLQPEEIQKVTFEQSVFSGYKKEDVDAFLDKVHDEYSRLYKENAELVQKLKVCIAKIEEYREDEKFLKSAIVNAQKLNETAMQEIELKKQEVEEAARKQADDIVSEAKIKAQQLLDENNQKIADLKEKNTREFAQQQLDQANSFAAKKREYESMISEKKVEFEALQERIDLFKESVMTIFNQQIDLLTKLPEIEKPAVVEEQQVGEPAPEVEVVIDEVAAPVAVEAEEVSTDSDTEEAPVIESTAEVEEVSEELPATDEPVVDEVIAEPVVEETEDDAVEAEEVVEATETQEEFAAEQIDIEELIAVKPSPVEPEAPELPVIDDRDDAASDDQEEEFHLFGTSPLVFPTDIPEDDEEDLPLTKEKSSRFKKKLKFGVDFDVKKDK